MYRTIETNYEDDEVFLKDDRYDEIICRCTYSTIYSFKECLTAPCSFSFKNCGPEDAPQYSSCSLCILPFALLSDILLFPLRNVGICLSCY